jgi:NCAIR mutase (PurE)-related protein
MNNKYLEGTLNDVASGAITPEEAMEKLKNLPYEDIGFAHIDHHRYLRTGYPETVFCQGKTSKQIAGIMEKLVEKNDNVFGTRATLEDYEAVKKVIPDAKYHDEARIIAINRNPVPVTDTKIAIVSAGTADIPVAEEAALTAEMLGNEVMKIYDVGVAGIHRLFANLEKIRSAKVIVVVAGMEGALASVIGGLVDKPVIAVPTSVGYGANLGGVATLLSMLNSCANGVCVVNIDNGYGAGYLASMINRIR